MTAFARLVLADPVLAGPALVSSGLAGSGLAIAVLALVAVTGGAAPADAAPKAKAEAGAAKLSCATKRGKGWGFNESQARFQAWEIIGQTTGNWPFVVDTYRNERYKCAPDGSGVTCYSWIDVCKKA